MLHDSWGLPATTRRADVLACFDDALMLVLGAHGEPRAAIDAALADEPTFALGACLAGALQALDEDAPCEPALAARLAAIAAGAQQANRRERAHAAAAAAALAGDARAAADRYDAIAAAWPRDALALHVAHAFDLRHGRRERMRARLARALPHWDARDPGFGHVLALYAFALEENGAYAAGAALARAALAHEPRNPAAVHAMAHVLEMQGRAAEGLAWLRAHEAAWAPDSGYAVHNAWHLALFHLERDEPARALAVHDERIAAPAQGATSALVDASALLWRLELRGVAPGARWQPLAAHWHARLAAGARAFNFVHAMLAFVGAADADGADRVLTELRTGATTRRANSAADLDLATPVCEAILAFAQRDYPTAVRRLARVRRRASRCGGSVAQCDLVHLTLFEAALRGRRAALARELAAERGVRRRPSPFGHALIARATLATS